MVPARTRPDANASLGYARRAVWLCAAASALAAAGRAAEPPLFRIADPVDREIARSFLEHTVSVPKLLAPERCARLLEEDAESGLREMAACLAMPITAHRLTGDERWLEVFAESFKGPAAALTRGRDGLVGWHGAAGRPAAGDLLMAQVLCRFLEGSAANASLAERLSGVRGEVLGLLQDHLARRMLGPGKLVDLGRAGSALRAEAGPEAGGGSVTEPHLAAAAAGRTCLWLYGITGRNEYMRAAIGLGTRFKRCLSLKAGRYEWNHWDPAGDWDADPADRGAWRGWIGPDGPAGRLACISFAVALHQHGLVFDSTDIQRFLGAQLEMLRDGAIARLGPSGLLCPALAPYSEGLEQLVYWGIGQEERLGDIMHARRNALWTGDWLIGKYVDLPRARSEPRPHAETAARFLGSFRNRWYVRRLGFAVRGEGYRCPLRPPRAGR